MQRLTRRQWLKRTAAAGLPLACGPFGGIVLGDTNERKKGAKLPVAAVVTTYRRNSHADVIVGKILEGYDQSGGPGPRLELASLYADQVPQNDLSRPLAKKHGFRIAETIDEALTLGTDTLQVAGVLSIGEHGDYPYTPETKQHMYPRRRFFDEIVRTFQRCGRVVPVFNDKHFAYRWEDARHMDSEARKLRIPLMAGSSLPVAWRVPAVTLPQDCDIEAALTVGYGGLESYGFHALESHQCLFERRRGGETGVRCVQVVRGEQLWQAERDGRWSRPLLQAALAAMPDVPEGKLEDRLADNAAFFLLEYRDGLKATVAMANGLARHFAAAVKLRGKDEPLAVWFKLQDEVPYGHFAYLLHAIENMVHTGRPSYPAERTLLTTGVLDAAMHSAADGGKRIETPHLDVAYTAVDWPFAGQEGSEELLPAPGSD